MIPAQHMVMPGPTAQQVRGLDSPSESTAKFGGGSSPRRITFGRAEESKHQGAARLDNPEGQVLLSQDHARKSAKGKDSLSLERKKEMKEW